MFQTVLEDWSMKDQVFQHGLKSPPKPGQSTLEATDFYYNYYYYYYLLPTTYYLLTTNY